MSEGPQQPDGSHDLSDEVLIAALGSANDELLDTNPMVGVPLPRASLDELKEALRGPKFKFSIGPTTVAVVLLIALILYYLWANDSRLLTQFFPETKPSIMIIDSQLDQVLILRQEGSASFVEVKRTGQATSLFVSAATQQVSAPSFSPDGDRVAYIAVDKQEIHIVSLSGPDIVVITAGQLSSLPQPQRAVVEICPWTSIAWSPDSSRLAFFVCLDGPATSLIVITSVSSGGGQYRLVSQTQVESNNERQLAWLNENEIVATALDGNDVSETLQMFIVP